jgi:uncharacterized membrane protein
MPDQNPTIQQLSEQLARLTKQHINFSREIQDLKRQMAQLEANESAQNSAQETVNVTSSVREQPKAVANKIPESESANDWEANNEKIAQQLTQKQSHVLSPQANRPENSRRSESPVNQKTNLERWIGENLINKIGILITVIGIGIGAKYSIENDLISPLTRIILGYLSALGLLGFGIKLKKNYQAYSAVLVSGAIATLYMVTFFAYSFYALLPQSVAFILMVIFTCFTVVAAINYNKQIIAHFGLVGAYAVPFLLSDDSGRVEILFSYVAIINAGILFIAFKKYWKALYYSAFGFTWVIYLSWFVLDYTNQEHFLLALGFLLLFYLIFYTTFLAYKLIRKEVFLSLDIVMLLLNSFLFYAVGYVIIDQNPSGENYLGLFTLFNAIVHFIVAFIFYKKQLADKRLFYLATAMVLTFIAIAIPVQLEGNWITILWIAQAAAMFWIGTSKNISIYEKLSYPLILLAFVSLIMDWGSNYDTYFQDLDLDRLTIFNSAFLTSVIFVAGLGGIILLSRKRNIQITRRSNNVIYQITNYVLPGLFLYSLWNSIRLEIAYYWDRVFQISGMDLGDSTLSSLINQDYSLLDFKSVWVINYSLLFISLVILANGKWIKNKLLTHASLALSFVAVFLFLTQGLYDLSELREAYLQESEYYNRGLFYIIIRYISLPFLALTLYMMSRALKEAKIAPIFTTAYRILLHISIIWVLSSELIHWLDIASAKDSYKLGLSILWGVYSLAIIGYGIFKNKSYFRIGGIALFTITLVKLFFYDIAHLSTISKTIVFVSLGVLLLIISFLYNKYKNQINYDDTSHEEDVKE